MSRVDVDDKRCLLCGMCVQVCFGVSSSTAYSRGLPEPGEDTCIDCGHCVAVCPADALQHSNFAHEKTFDITHELRPAPEQVMELIRTRRSIRCFLERKVEKERLLELIEAARYAPSATNSQSTEYIVVTNPDTLARVSTLTVEFLTKTVRQVRNPIVKQVLQLVAHDELDAITPYLTLLDSFKTRLSQGEDPILYDAPALIVFHSRTDVNFPGVNAAIAAHNAALYAESLGLGTLFAGFVVGACKRDRRLHRLLSVPEDHRVYAALAVGYPKFRYRRWVERREPHVTWLE